MIYFFKPLFAINSGRYKHEKINERNFKCRADNKWQWQIIAVDRGTDLRFPKGFIQGGGGGTYRSPRGSLGIWWIRTCGSWDMQVDRQTDRRWSQYFAWSRPQEGVALWLPITASRPLYKNDIATAKAYGHSALNNLCHNGRTRAASLMDNGDYAVEHSNSRFESIRFYSLCESIRIDSFCKKSAFWFTSCVEMPFL